MNLSTRRTTWCPRLKKLLACASRFAGCAVLLLHLSWPAAAQSTRVEVQLREVEPQPLAEARVQAAKQVEAVAVTGWEVLPARSVQAHEAGVSVRFDRVSREEALQRLAAFVDVRLAYSRDLVSLSDLISLRLEDVTLRKALRAVLRGSSLEVVLSHGYLVITPLTSVAVESPQALVSDRRVLTNLKKIRLRPRPAVQTGTITGTVTDSTTGETLPGVNVVIVGTTQGAATDAEGRYTIPDVEAGTYTLQASFVGYNATTEEQVTVRDGETTTVDFALQPSTEALEEVLVIGYGEVQKSNFAGAVSQISSEVFERVPATNPLEAIQGRIPGLRIVPNSGLPGSSASVDIRGLQSIRGSNAPLFVVDGTITTSIDHLNVQDIESISVLKDASAAAIYGARAANGVILITTKRGASGAGPSFTFNTYFGVQQLSNGRLHLLNADEWLEVWTEAYTNSGISTPWNQEDLAAYEGVDSDWFGAIMQPGYLRSFDLSVSGGTDRSNYYISVGNLYNRGMVLGTAYRRVNLRLNSDHQITDWLSFGNSLNIFSSKQNGLSGQYTLALQKVPLTRIYEDDGSWGRVRNTALEHNHANPLFLADDVDKEIERGAKGNLYLTLSLLEGLEFTTRASLEWVNEYNTGFTQGIPPGLGWEGSPLNEIEKGNEEALYWQTNFLLHYDRSFGGKHHVSGLLGYSLEEQTVEVLEAEGNGTPNNSIRYLNAVDPTSLNADNDFADWSFESMFGRVSYRFLDRYILSGTIRRDGTSRLAEGHRYGVFPSISAAWRISEEGFMDDVDWLNELKLRASWGTLGNILSIDPYGTIASLDGANYVYDQEPAAGFTLASAVNPDLKWESTTKKNVGLDVAMFANRLSVSADFYIADTYDLLFEQPIPSSTGLEGSPFINAGHVRNRGIELTLGYQNSIGDWRYSFRANLTHLKNNVVDLEGRDLRTSGIVEGYPLRSYFGYKSNGLIRTQEDLNRPQFPGKELGDIWFADTNGDGVVDAEDRIIIGNNYPNLLYGATGSVGFKDFTLQVQLQGVEGVLKDIRGGDNSGVLHYFTLWPLNHARFILDRFHAQKNPDGQFPRVTAADEGSNLLPSSFWLFDASYLRISNINLSYDFPDILLQRFNIENLGAYISVQNVYTFTDFIGPEVDSTADELTGVPVPRTWTVGMRIRF